MGSKRSKKTLHARANRADHAEASRRHAADEPATGAAGTDIPSDLQLEYYTQRASDGGLIITEATAIAASARGYYHAPGLYADEQVAGWKRITDAVHAKGAYFFTQLWHAGRTTHVSITGSQPVTASVDPTYWADPSIVVDTPDGFSSDRRRIARWRRRKSPVLSNSTARPPSTRSGGFRRCRS